MFSALLSRMSFPSCINYPISEMKLRKQTHCYTYICLIAQIVWIMFISRHIATAVKIQAIDLQGTPRRK